MGKIGDLWVKLGLKSEDFNKGIKDAEAKTGGFGSAVTKVKGIAVAAWAAVGAAAAKMTLDFIQSSNKLGDAWDQTMARVKAAWQTFTSALTSWNWDNFFGRMKNAADAAASLAAERDREMEVENSIKLRKSAMDEELELLQIQARNQKLSYAEREKAAKDYLDKVEPLYDDEIALRKRLMESTAGTWLKIGGLEDNEENRRALEQFLSRLETDTEMMQQLQNRASDSKEAYNEYLKWAASDLEGEDWKRMSGALYDIYNTIAGRDDTNQALVDAIANYNYSKGAFYKENRRIYSSMNSAGAQISGASVDSAETAEIKAFAEALAEAADEARALAEEERSISEREEEMLESLHRLAEERGVFDPLLESCNEYVEGLIKAREEEENLKEASIDMGQILSDLTTAAIQGFSDSIQEMMNGLMGMEEIDGGQIFASLLIPLAQTVTSMGEMLMAAGIAELEFVKALTNPALAPAAIAAGAALIAIGSAASAGLRSLAQGGSASSATTSYASSSYTPAYGTMTSELTVHVEGVVKGSNIILSGQETLNEWNK